MTRERTAGHRGEEGAVHDCLTTEEKALAERPLAELSDVELERWSFACLRMSGYGGSRFSRWRWRRRWCRALDAIDARTTRRLGAGPPLCERCRQTRPTVHLVYGRGETERHAHLCARCSKAAPSAWFIVVEADP